MFATKPRIFLQVCNFGAGRLIFLFYDEHVFVIISDKYMLINMKIFLLSRSGLEKW
jgi:hypothetical protein